MSEEPAKAWYVYILKCSDNSLYTGVTTDLERRLKEHNSSALGARYTRVRRPVTMVYNEHCANRSSACVRESKIKKLSRAAKLKLIESLPA